MNITELINRLTVIRELVGPDAEVFSEDASGEEELNITDFAITIREPKVVLR